jgi:hypothetical protein
MFEIEEYSIFWFVEAIILLSYGTLDILRNDGLCIPDVPGTGSLLSPCLSPFYITGGESGPHFADQSRAQDQDGAHCGARQRVAELVLRVRQVAGGRRAEGPEEGEGVHRGRRWLVSFTSVVVEPRLLALLAGMQRFGNLASSAIKAIAIVGA